MKVTRTERLTRPQRTGKAASAAQGAPAAFTAGASSAARATGAGTVRSSGPVAPVNSVDALMALQGGGDRETREGMERGADLLDRLDALKLAIIEGRDLRAAAEQLRTLAATAREDAGVQPGARDVLNQIDVRAAVELAKLERPGRT